MSKIRQALLILCFLLAPLLLAPQSAAARTAPPVTILTPGEGSILTSPIHLTATLQPGADTFLRVALINENNITIARQLLRINPDDQSPTHFEAFLPFEIPTQTTEVLLTVATLDEYHRPQSMRSVALTLSTDEADVTLLPASVEAWLTITDPAPMTIITGGKLPARGTVTPLTGSPIIFELITDTGGVIGSSQLAVTSPGEPLDFELSLTYAYITSPRDVRLVVRQPSENYTATAILDSLLLTLAP